MSDDRYDDGLVHEHRWATEPARPEPRRAPAIYVRAPEDSYDDGLVHAHRWATEGRRRS